MLYLDNAATTLIKPKQVYKSIINTMKNAGGNAGRGGHLMADAAAEIIYTARENVCKLFNIKNTMEVCFTNNATTALNYGIKGVLKPGDHVIMSCIEHNSVLRPIYKLSKNNDITYTVLPGDNKGNLESIENYIQDNTKLIVINHASNVLGTISNIAEIGKIAREHNIIFMIDASQSAGHLDIDVERDNIDILACSGHKSLFGPQGTGILYIRSEISADTIIEGGTGSMSRMLEHPIILPDRFEAGTLNAPGISGLSAGINFILNTGIENIRSHEIELTDMLLKGLTNIKGTIIYGNESAENRVGVVGFNLGEWDSVNLSIYLNDRYKAMVRGGLHCSYLAHKTADTLDQGCIRVSLSYFNTKHEVEKFLNIIDMV